MIESMRIFTDGASRGNPGPGGWGAVCIDFEAQTVTEYGGREDNTTNNRMELTAIAEALHHVPEEMQVTVFTDSGYVVKGVTRWIKNWRRNNWQTTQKTDVLNRDVWERLDHELSRCTVSWKHIGGHVGLPGNERADDIATAYADNKTIELYEGSIGSYGVDIMQSVEDSGKKDARSAAKSRRAQKAYSYVSKVDDDIQTHATWEETEKRVTGVSGARFKKSVSSEDEAAIIREFKAQD